MCVFQLNTFMRVPQVNVHVCVHGCTSARAACAVSVVYIRVSHLYTRVCVCVCVCVCVSELDMCVSTAHVTARLRSHTCLHARALGYRTLLPNLSSGAMLKREARQQHTCSDTTRARFTTASFRFIRVEAQKATSCWHVCACPSFLNCLGSLHWCFFQSNY